VQYPTDRASFTIVVNGVVWFENEGVMLTSGNKTYHSGNNLTLVSNKLVAGEGPWGAFEGSSQVWTTTADGYSFVTTVKLYPSAGVVTFTQSSARP
jgi:hypothetical protein